MRNAAVNYNSKTFKKKMRNLHAVMNDHNEDEKTT